MSEISRSLPFEAVDQPTGIAGDILPGTGTFSDTETACHGIKRVLIDRTEQARLAGQFYWERDEVVDRPEILMG